MSFRTLIGRGGQRCLLTRAVADADAFGAFYGAYAERVMVFFARRVLDVDVAFDLTAETFAIALERRRQFRGRTAEEEQGWLFAIARSQLSRYWRAGTVEREVIQRLGVGIPALDDAEIERVERLAGLQHLRPVLAEALARLPGDQQQAIRLRVIEEKEYGQVAAAMDVSEQVARARVSRGLRSLAHSLPATAATAIDLA